MQTFVTFMLEGCIEIGLQVGICLVLMNNERFSTPWEFFSSVLVIIFATSMIFTPIYLCIAMRRVA